MKQSGNSSTPSRIDRLRSRAARRAAAAEPRAQATHHGPERRLQSYVRQRDLPRLLPIFPDELEAATSADHGKLVDLLRRALRIERRRGLSGDWSYDLARHAHLLEAYRCELAALEARQAASSRPLNSKRDRQRARATPAAPAGRP